MTFNKDWRISMRNSVGPIVVFMMVGLWVLASAVDGERFRQQHRPYKNWADEDKREFPCSDKWWLFPLTRDRVFLSLNLTSHQRKEISRLNDKFKEDLLDFKRRHNESLLNVLDDNQRQKLEEKKGEIDRYLEENKPFRHYRRPRPSSNSNNIEKPFSREDWPDHWRGDFPIEIGIKSADASIKLPETNIDPTTWGGVKKEFKE